MRYKDARSFFMTLGYENWETEITMNEITYIGS